MLYDGNYFGFSRHTYILLSKALFFKFVPQTPEYPRGISWELANNFRS